MSQPPIPRTFKALFTDLDGTAIPSHPEALPSPKVIEAVEKAQQKIFVSVATGRPYSMCREILHKLKIQNPCIVEGGSQIRDPKTDQIFEASGFKVAMGNAVQDLKLIT
jgi:HAD superfamily hydrolase (TIGR01484 family)